MAENNEIKKLDGKSADIEATDKEKLKSVFPQCFTEDKLDIDKLLNLCGEYISNDFEKYKFEWKGKADCYKVAGKRSTGTLRPCPEDSVDFDKTNNLYIEGDNLEVLKLLQSAYYRKVKMIYLDPPYNTGHDFVYEDDFADPIAKYKEITSQTTKSNPETMGRYHTNWLNMMYPRLRLAANLLRDDGVIFISIDDNEVTNLRRLCDEVFGEENFVSQVIVQTNPRGRTFDRFIAKTHEYILVYTKNIDIDGLHEIPKDEKAISEYSKQDEYGKYRLLELRNRNPVFNRSNRPLMFYPLYADPQKLDVSLTKTDRHIIEIYPRNSQGEDGCWTWGLEKASKCTSLLVANLASTGKWSVFRKDYLEGTSLYTKSKAIWLEKEMNHENGKEMMGELFGKTPFDFPKSVEYIKKCLQIGTFGKEPQIIMDFFSGSATTAHAAMQLNAEDGGNRQFIMVQLPEKVDDNSEAAKAGYTNICEIGKERIRRAGAKILESLKTSPLRGEVDTSVSGEGDKLNLLSFARDMRHNPTDAENKLWYALRNNRLGYKFRRQHQIGNYIVDFVCLEKKLVIECDGGQHNENVDKKRTEFLNKEGYFVLRFWNNEILSNINGVLFIIKDKLDNTPHPDPLPQGARESFATAQGARESLDVGFKVFKLDTSNLVKWDDTPTDDTQALKERFDTMVKSLKFDRSELDVVYEVMLKLGIPLTYKVSEMEINNRKVYSIGDDGLILVCLDGSNGGITPEDIEAMCDLTPAKIIAAEEAFKDDVALSNAYYISKDKGIEIELL